MVENNHLFFCLIKLELYEVLSRRVENIYFCIPDAKKIKEIEVVLVIYKGEGRNWYE